MNICNPSPGQLTSLHGLPIWSYPLEAAGPLPPDSTVPGYLTDQSLFPSAAASTPLDHLDRLCTSNRGPPRQANAVYGLASLLPPSFKNSCCVCPCCCCSLLIQLQLLHLLTNLSLLQQKTTSGGYSRQATAVFRMASSQKNIPSPIVNGGHSRQANAVFQSGLPLKNSPSSTMAQGLPRLSWTP